MGVIIVVLVKTSNTKIHQFDPVFGVNHDVGWLEVAVNYRRIVSMQIMQNIAYLS